MTKTTDDFVREKSEQKWQASLAKIRARTESSGGSIPPILDSSRCDPDCPHCDGAGFIRYDVPVGHPQFGKLIPCPNFQAKHRNAMSEEELFEKFGLYQNELNMDWGLVKNKIGNLRIEATKAVAEIKPRLDKPQPFGFGALIGSYGQGKTLAGKIMIATALRKGHTCAFVEMQKVLTHIKRAFDSETNMTHELLARMDHWMNLDVLCIDEVDKAHGTPWAVSVMFELINHRYVRAVRGDALTVMASNSSDNELEGYLLSRLHDARVGFKLVMNGDDIRPVLAENYQF